ncbi:Riboflavin synthase [Caprobacter fermentans]|uniref:Riboflavin synthase n=1 Tax=Caproicibacter fermentans TaxID=2576756 RepID=A0A6N8HXV1_9FIRM|nr:riboflavin synthase [Caproicibacter fermentans]MVB10173.1 Riboflavin synthase [Caproicibacter fermentans]OCN00820.1 riboflavin synthase subunit alpha [Clostridium sp. W14A]QNK41764.1 riboflavin synthase [Caproicibacter fermentans]
MFTGIIEETGTIRSIKKIGRSAALTIGASAVLDGLRLGDSIAVSGVCLTVVSLEEDSFSADVMNETAACSNLLDIKVGGTVNLERAMPLNGRFGGHIVAGHIDGTGVISSMRQDENAIWFTVRTFPRILRYVINKGSIAIDGISLTVAGVTEKDFSVSVIPHTAQNTTLGEKRVGFTVNLENDCIGKYVEKLLRAPGGQSGISKEFLARYGF